MLALARLSRRTALHIRLSLVKSRALPTVALALTMAEMDELELAHFICEMGSQDGHEWFWSELARPPDSSGVSGSGTGNEARIEHHDDHRYHRSSSKAVRTHQEEKSVVCCISAGVVKEGSLAAIPGTSCYALGAELGCSSEAA